MAIAPVRKVHIVAHRSHQTELTAALQKLGAVEIRRSSIASDSAEGPVERRALEARLRRIDRALDLLSPYVQPPPLMEKVYPRTPRYSEGELDEIVESFDLDEFLSACEGNNRELEELKLRLSRLDEERKELSRWASLDAPPSMLHSSERVEVVTGRLPRHLLGEGEAATDGIGAILHTAGVDNRFVYIVIICHRSCGPSLLGTMEVLGFQEMAMTGLEVTPAERLVEIDAEKKKLRDRTEELRDAYRALEEGRNSLLILRDVTAARLDRLKAERLMGFTGRTFALEGWVTGRSLPEVYGLCRRFPLVSVHDSEPGPHDQVPVVLENSPLVRPFGLVVDLYGLPRYGTLDPSTVLAFSFAVFFGLCLTDGGYGLFLAAVTGALLHFAPRPLQAGAERFLKMLFICGLATAVAGALAGGWFGVSLRWRLFDPLGDLMLFFLIALSAGTLHIFAGLSLRMVRQLREGNVIGALADQGLWMVLVLSLGGIAAGAAGAVPRSVYGAFRFFALLSAAGIVCFQGRPEKGAAEGKERLHNLLWSAAALSCAAWLYGAARPWSGYLLVLILAAELFFTEWSLKRLAARLGLGLYALYGITGYLSDILSYSRLVALGLGTGIVALVVNKMAAVGLAAPVIGLPLAGAVLVVGHLFNIMINLLGAFVHSCRLQYVEFFTKFYESGGRPFSPFRLATRYIIIEEQS